MSDTTRDATTAASLATGKVLGKDGSGVWRVAVGDVRHDATLAAGCILEPAKGDTVLVACSEAGAVYIIQILERPDDAAATLRLPRTSAFLAGGDGEGRLRVEASEVAVSGGILRSTFRRVVSLAESVEVRAGVLREHYARRFEEVDGVKDTKLGRLRCLVGGLLSLRGDTVDVRAEKRAKIDGEAVDIG